jgi:CubicO group peptidase (beta-lactamase class C family)
MNRVEKFFIKKLADTWVNATPSLQIQAYLGGRKKLDLSFGKYYQYYDLASLTKVLFTGRAIMSIFADKKLKKTSLVQDILPWWPHRETDLQHLLTHSSGMIWWKPYYEELRMLPKRADIRFEHLASMLKETPLVPSDRSVYSDSGFLLLGIILEELEDKSLYEIWLQNQDAWHSKNELHFRPIFTDGVKDQEKTSRVSSSETPPDKYAPTEKCLWQKKMLQGVVHDENARALGGVAPHAGLFGAIDDVADYLLALRKILRGEVKNPVISAQLLRSFTQRAIPRSQGDWSLGWMMPTKGASSGGRYLTASSVGHTGFTGTSMWWDIKKDLIIIILSNRVNFGRENKSFAQLRPLLHDFTIESLEV